MSEPLDDQYLDWLYNLVGLQEENVYHYELMKLLLSREFSFMPDATGDENRCNDGISIRKQFVKSNLLHPDYAWMHMGCSVLEMMIGVARHLSFSAEGEEGEWFWHLCDNLGIARYNDKRWSERRVDQIIERLIWRQYSFDGNGGLFPLKEPHEDQRYVEIWFQMEAYILEMR